MHQVEAGHRGGVSRPFAARHRDPQGAGTVLREAGEPPPDVRAGQVDTHHVGAPAQQRLQRSHFRARAQDHDGVAAQGEPVRMRRHLPDGFRARRLDAAHPYPLVQLAEQVIGAQPVAVKGHRQLALRLVRFR